MKVTRGLFAEAFRNLLYTPEASAQAPRLVRQLLHGDELSLVETALSGRTVLGGDRLAAGFFLSVSCTEDVPFVRKDTAALAACIATMIGAFLERGSAEGLDRACAAANPAPPFLLSGPGK